MGAVCSKHSSNEIPKFVLWLAWPANKLIIIRSVSSLPIVLVNKNYTHIGPDVGNKL